MVLVAELVNGILDRRRRDSNTSVVPRLEVATCAVDARVPAHEVAELEAIALDNGIASGG